ncbi:MAG: LamG domain-containing protein [Planctomycetota bacterium]|jgi:hypothetical protein
MPVCKPPFTAIIDKTHPLGKSATDDTEGLAFFWLLNEGKGYTVQDSRDTINTSAGAANYGSVHADCIWTGAKFGYGIDFDGSNDGRLDSSGLREMANKLQFTFHFWLYSRSDGESNQAYIFDCNDTTFLRFNNADTTVRFYTDHSTTDGIWQWSSLISSSEWCCYTLTYDGSSNSNDPVFYRNGLVISSTEVGTPDGTFSTPFDGSFCIGTSYASSVRELDGIIDHIAIWNRVLTLQEIQTLYQDPFCMFKQRNIASIYTPPAAGGVRSCIG